MNETNVRGGGTFRVCLCFCSQNTSMILPSLKILSRDMNIPIEVIGVLGDNRIDVHMEGKVLPFIPINEFPQNSCNMIILCGTNYHTNYHAIVKELKDVTGHSYVDVLPDRVVCMPGFSLAQHRRLIQSKLSILSMNCFGGLVSHLLTLPFLTPFVNLYTTEEPFLDMLEKEPRIALDGTLDFCKMEYNPEERHDYPIFSLNGMPLHFLHYSDVNDARDKWVRRQKRINWYNLAVIMYTDSPEILDRFDSLPFAKKICFVSFPSDKLSAYPLLGDEYDAMPIYQRVNYVGWGFRHTYNLWDMLLYEKKTLLK